MAQITLTISDSVALQLKEEAALYQVPVEQLASQRFQVALETEEDYDWSLHLPESELEWMRKEVAIALDEFERGEGLDGPTAMAALRAELHQKYGLNGK